MNLQHVFTTYIWYFCALIIVLGVVLPVTMHAQSDLAITLTAPTTVDSGESFSVSYTGTPGTDRDWVGVYEVGTSDRLYEAYKYVNGTDGSLTFTLNIPGIYEARYFSDNKYLLIATSDTFTVDDGNTGDNTNDDEGTDEGGSAGGDTTGDDGDTTDDDPGSGDTGTYELSVSVNEVSVEEIVVVDWIAPASVSRSRDWIGVYEVGASDRRYQSYKYIDASATSDSLSFPVRQPGEYEFRYFKNGRYTKVATSDSFTVTAADTNDDTDDNEDNTGGGNDTGGDDTTMGSYELSISATEVGVGDTIEVDWEAPTGARLSRDWIGVYEVGTSDRQYEAYEYVNTGDSSGSVTVTLRQPGEYEFRYFKNGRYERVAVSDSFTVTAVDDTGGDGGDTDDGDTDGDSGDDDDTVTDTYELSVAATTIAVGDTIEVDWEAPSGSNRYRDWIGLFRVGDDDRDYIYYGYVNRFDTSGTLTFQVNVPGTYEFRYFKNNKYERVATSPTFTVTNQDGGSGGQCAVADLSGVVNYPPSNGPIVAFGDSLTAGVGASAGQDYVSQLSRQAGVSIRNAGVSGDTTEDALARLESDVLTYNPSVVIVWLGGNDIISRFYEDVEAGLENLSFTEFFQFVALKLAGKIPDSAGITEEETFENLTTIIERIQAEGVVTIVVGFSGGIFDDDLEELYEEVAEETGSLYVPNALENVAGRPSLMGDLVHPNGDGYTIVASRVLPYLQCTI